LKTPEEVYNKLYLSYAEVLIAGIDSNSSWVAETEMSAVLRDKEIREIKEAKRQWPTISDTARA